MTERANCDKYTTGKRWTIKRKAEVIASVFSGDITVEDALRENDLTAEEFAEWRRLYNKYGPNGLRTTYLGQYR